MILLQWRQCANFHTGIEAITLERIYYVYPIRKPDNGTQWIASTKNRNSGPYHLSKQFETLEGAVAYQQAQYDKDCSTWEWERAQEIAAFLNERKC